MASIFKHLSFSTLNETQKGLVRAYVKNPMLSTLDTYDVFKHQYELEITLSFWDNQINTLAQFIFDIDCADIMSAKQTILLQDELSFVLYLFSARYQLSLKEGLGHNLSDEGEQIKKCIAIINALNKHKNAITNLELPTVSDDGIKNGLDWMGYWNERRLYWVWAGRGGLLGCLIDLLPEGYFNKSQALKALDVPVPITGGASWALYYFRCGIRLSLLLRHSINGFWMSQEEKDIPWQERFAMQLYKMKFNLINDFFWACGNLVCFFWACGAADYYGGALTTLLLLMDVGVTVWAYSDEHTQYLSDITRYKKSINMLMEDAVNNHLQIQALNKAEYKCRVEWNYKLYALYADILYATGLMLAFALLYGFFLPTIAPTALILGVTGTVLCFSLNAVFAAIRQSLEICKAIELSNHLAQDYLNPNNSAFDLNLIAHEWHYQQQVIQYQKAILIRSVLVDLLVPPLVFLALVFTPLSIGVPIVLAGFLLAVAAHYFIENNYQPDRAPKAAINQDGELIAPIITQGFFAKGTALLEEKSIPTIEVTSTI